MALLALVPVLAAAPSAQAQSFTFSSIAVEGNQRIETRSILAYAGIEPGRTVSAAEVNDAYQGLINTGLFETVEVLPQGRTLLIRVTEYPTINVINFEGNRRLSDDDLAPLVTSQPRRVYSPVQAEVDAGAIADAYREKGRMTATVKPVIIRRADNRVDLVFEIREGRVTEIERLTFVGNRNFSERRLRTALQTKQAGLLRALIGRDTFVADRIEFDKQVLRDFYLSRGYIDFDVLSVTSEFSQERNAFFLTFNIREGLSYDFGRITTTTELAEVNAAEFDALLKLRPGMTYSPALVEDAVARMEGLATKKGLNFIRVDPKITRDDANQRLDIEFQIVRGPRIFVERIDIEGNTTTIDRVVRREFKTVEGDPFNPREIRAAAERIRALGFFSTADVNAREGSSPDRVILDVNLDEQPTGSLSFGASYSTDSGVGLALGFTERNLMGRGQYLRFSIDSGTSESNSEITFIEPHFLDRDLALGLSLYYNTTDSDDSAEYDTKIIGFRPSIEFPLSDNGRLALRYTVQQDEISNVSTTNSSRILQLDEAGSPRLTSSVGYSYTYDSSRTGLDPRSRLMFRFSQDFAGLGGDANYLRTTALLSAERKTLNEDITFRAEFEAGALHMISGQSFLSDRFFLSSRQMRGFEGQGIGPRDNAAPNRDALGGNYYAVSRFEAEFPIGLPEEYGITGGLFYDVGTLWGLDNRNGGVGGLNRVDDNAYLRSAIGFSIYWNTQIGPLRFNFSKAIDKQPYDKERNFDLTIQTRF